MASDTGTLRSIARLPRFAKLARLLRRALREIDAAIMPCRCAFCGLVVRSRDRGLCEACHADLPWQTHACRRCGVPVPSELPAGVSCARCQVVAPPFVATVAPLEYAFPLDAAIKAFKFHRKLHYLPALATVLVDVVAELPDGIDAVSPVPLHRWRHMRRGFNQSALLAQPVARALGVPLADTLRRCHATPYQSASTVHERRRNLAHAFAVRPGFAATHVLIVDDVITTGATCGAVARTLLRAGVAEVSVLAVAHA